MENAKNANKSISYSNQTKIKDKGNIMKEVKGKRNVIYRKTKI